jgi:hypothetical protein
MPSFIQMNRLIYLVIKFQASLIAEYYTHRQWYKQHHERPLLSGSSRLMLIHEQGFSELYRGRLGICKHIWIYINKRGSGTLWS